MRFYGLTGTPGTGKKTLAPIVAKALGIKPVSLNEIACSALKDENVDVSLLAKKVRRLGEKSLLYGHLLPHVLEEKDTIHVTVLRCEPMVLKRRLEERGYSAEKVRVNLEAELIGIIAYQCYKKFGREKVSEFDTTKADTSNASKKIVSIMLGQKNTEPIDWSISYDKAEKLKLLLS
jgi:adenylate kinase